MRYDEILLAVGKEEARQRIAEQVSDVRVEATDGQIEYRTHADILLASLTDVELPSGESGTKLRYRTSPADSQLSYVKRRTSRIKQAVWECAVT